jgi:hypothetical protein
MRRLLALTLLISSLACGCAAGLAAPAALAAGGASTALSFSLTSGGASSTPQTTTVAPVTTTSSSSGGLSSLDAAIIAVVAALLLGGVAFWIWYDARGHAARAGHEESMFSQRAHAGSKTPHKPRKLTPAERKRRKRGRAR